MMMKERFAEDDSGVAEMAGPEQQPRRGIAGRRVRTADSGFLILLEVVVHKAEYEG